jgi:hypothetical protein
VIRWLRTPLALVTLGMTLGILVLRLDLTGSVFDWDILIPLTTAAAVLAYLLTLVLLRFERATSITMRDHLRHMWIVYPFWLLGSLGLGGGHGALLFIMPFAALSGVMIGNLVAVAVSLRGRVTNPSSDDAP